MRIDYEIYYSESEHIGVNKMGGLKFETLIKEGDKYIVEGNRHGEFYIVDNDKNMTLFDNDGDLTGAGYSAKKK